MKSPLSRLEARMEELLEGTFTRLFAGSVHPRDIALQLARALEDSAAIGPPATRYTVLLNPADAQALLQAEPRLPQALAEELLKLAREALLTLAEAPQVRFEEDAGQRPRSLRVTAESAGQSASATQTMAPVRPAAQAAAPRAFLILNGERTVNIREPVISLGRRFDNQIVVDDPRVSRTHAQMRLRFGRYVVYDLGSTGGTMVNGQRIDECVLRPGDVISLGGVPIIYGEEDMPPPQPSPHGTRPLLPPQ